VLNESPTGAERSAACAEYLSDPDQLGHRGEAIPGAELDAIIDEACDHIRHSAFTGADHIAGGGAL